MPIKERREREQQILRQAILDAARAIATRDGWHAVTIRGIAEVIEYSPPTIYEYFDNKDAILRHLQEDGFQEVGKVMRAALAANRPAEQYRAVCQAYVTFALAQPELYQVMTELGGVRHSGLKPTESNRQLTEVARQALLAWSDSEQIQIPAIDEALIVTWVMLHGLVALHLSGYLINEPAAVDRLLQRALHDLMTAWRVG